MLAWKTNKKVYMFYLAYLRREIDKVNKEMYDFLLVNEYKMSLETNDVVIWNTYKEMYSRWMELSEKLREVEAFNKPFQEFVTT